MSVISLISWLSIVAHLVPWVPGADCEHDIRVQVLKSGADFSPETVVFDMGTPR